MERYPARPGICADADRSGQHETQDRARAGRDLEASGGVLRHPRIAARSSASAGDGIPMEGCSILCRCGRPWNWARREIIAIHALPEIPSSVLKPFVKGFRSVFGHHPPLPAGVELVMIEPQGPLGSVRDALVWKQENIERWIARGRGDRKKHFHSKLFLGIIGVDLCLLFGFIV